MNQKLRHKVNELERQLQRGDISRRDFLRSALALGLSLGVAEFLSGCDLVPAPSPTQTPASEFQAFIPGTDNIIPTPYGGVRQAPTSPPGFEPESRAAAGAATALAQPISWYCACCGQQFPSSEALKAHSAKEHGWRLPAIQRVDEPTYSQFVVGRVKRFDERNTVFSRTVWDEDYKARLQTIVPKPSADEEQALEGRALVAGAIYVDDTAGSFHPNYYGYMGRVKDTGGLYTWEDPVSPVQFPIPDPAWMAERIKQVARFYGANLVGICKVDPRWVYARSFERATGRYEQVLMVYQYAIVMGIEMDWKLINESPRLEASAATALVYSRMSELAGSLAKYIRALGYPAAPSGNDTGQNIPLAIDAGLGELGRNGLLLTPEYGSRVRICKVFTDLPLAPDKPIDFGIQSFCEACHSCAISCPSKAIRNEERTTEITSISNREGLLRWPVDVARCYLFWRENGSDCSNCIAVCPWAMHSQRDWLET